MAAITPDAAEAQAKPRQRRTPPKAEAPTLAQKLLEIAREITHVDKDGRNDHHKYDYVSAKNVVETLRKALLARDVLVTAATVSGSVRHHADTGGRGFVTTVDMLYTFRDAGTGETLEVPWTGAGSDTGGDKGLYKAFTGSQKYMFIQTFMLAMGDDPEADRETDGGRASQDAERPQAPRIPTDRAQYLLEAACVAGLAAWDAPNPPEIGAILQAKLVDLGGSKIGALNADQAESLEAFIRAEAEAAAPAGAEAA